MGCTIPCKCSKFYRERMKKKKRKIYAERIKLYTIKTKCFRIQNDGLKQNCLNALQSLQIPVEIICNKKNHSFRDHNILKMKIIYVQFFLPCPKYQTLLMSHIIPKMIRSLTNRSVIL